MVMWFRTEANRGGVARTPLSKEIWEMTTKNER